MRLNSGTYHVVSTYGSVNAVIRSDIRVEAGKLTEATVEHRAAELTMKLVREPGGEAIADTSWSLLDESGDPVREIVGAFASMVLAEGDYTIIAKNRDRIYQRDFTVVGGQQPGSRGSGHRSLGHRRRRRRRLSTALSDQPISALAQTAPAPSQARRRRCAAPVGCGARSKTPR